MNVDVEVIINPPWLKEWDEHKVDLETELLLYQQESAPRKRPQIRDIRAKLQVQLPAIPTNLNSDDLTLGFIVVLHGLDGAMYRAGESTWEQIRPIAENEPPNVE